MTEQPAQSTTTDAPARRALPAVVERHTGARFFVSLDGQPLGEAPSKARAISLLCEEALRRGSSVAVTVADGRTRSYMAISARGHVRDAAAPAPDFGSAARPPLRRDLGQSPDSEFQTQAWVEEAILEAVPATATSSGRRRWGLRRR